MSKIIIIIITLILYTKSTIALGFLDCISDIPVHNKIIEIKESCFLFDSDTGKIVSVEAKHLLSDKEVLDFYKNILKQFGWELKSEKVDKALIFLRDNEILKININDSNIILFNNFLSLKNNN